MDSEIDNYLNDNKSLVIAPAGHGKTTLLTKCILRLQYCSMGKTYLRNKRIKSILMIFKKKYCVLYH